MHDSLRTFNDLLKLCVHSPSQTHHIFSHTDLNCLSHVKHLQFEWFVINNNSISVITKVSFILQASTVFYYHIFWRKKDLLRTAVLSVYKVIRSDLMNSIFKYLDILYSNLTCGWCPKYSYTCLSPVGRHWKLETRPLGPACQGDTTGRVLEDIIFLEYLNFPLRSYPLQLIGLRMIHLSLRE
jgi:hypothetical protein